MKTPFKVGDRVRLRGTKHKVWVHELQENGFLLIRWDGATGISGPYHSEALIRLKPKKPRREWWVNVYADGGRVLHDSKEIAEQKGISRRLECVHVREVREKK